MFSSPNEETALRHYKALRDGLLSEAGHKQPTLDPRRLLEAERSYHDVQAVLIESARRRGEHGKKKGGRTGRRGGNG